MIVCENTTEATPEAVRTRVDRVGRDLSAAISRSPSAWLQAQWVDWRAQLVRIREESMQRPEVSIALVGGTGAGKSTLLNALLGARILPVSNMRACTAAISEVTYADEDRYTADIEFISRDEWQHETDLLRADIADSRAARDAAMSDGDASPPPAHISQPAWDKVKAVYNLGDDVDLMTVDLDRLTEPHDITRVLDVGACRIECDSLDEFRKKVDLYLNSRHPFWPIVKTVRICGPFESLRSGAKLVDLPGINDPNEAREAVTKNYLKTCRFVWIVFNIKRLLTKDILALMQSDDFLRQVVMDGRANALTLIATHTDGIDLDSARDEFGLDEDAFEIDVIEARNRLARVVLARQLDESALRVAKMAGEDKERAAKLAASLKQSCVYTISAREYLRLEGITKTKAAGIETTTQTELPALLDHMQELTTEYGVEAHAPALHYRLDMLLTEIDRALRSQRLRLGRQSQESDAITKEVESAVRQAHSFLEMGLKHDEQSLLQALEADERLLRERLQRGVERAQRELANVAGRWSGMHWCTLRAVARRRGSFRSSTGIQHNFVADLSRPVLDTITFVWLDFFGDRLGAALDNGTLLLHQTVGEYSQRLAEATALLDDDRPAMQKELQAIREQTKKVLGERLSVTRTAMQQRIEHDQRTLYERVPERIAANMVIAFDKAAEQSGRGVKARMLDVLRTHAQEVSAIMFGDAEEQIMQGVSALRGWLCQRYEDMASDVRRHADLMAQNLQRGATEISPETLAQELDGISALAAVIEPLLTSTRSTNEESYGALAHDVAS